MKGEYILGDCMEYLGGYADNHFDLAIVDPPYGIGEDGSKTKGRGYKKDGSRLIKTDKRTGRKYHAYSNYKPKNWDSKQPDQSYFDELFRVSKNQIIFGCNYLTFTQKARSSGRIFWDKVNGANDFSDGEMAFSSLFSSVRMFSFMWNGMLQGKSAVNGKLNQGNKKLCEKRQHPTQKPVELYRWLLRNYAKPNDLILDTHVGSASSLIACEMEGFKYVGFEKDSDYYQQSTKRIKQHLAQKVLF
jgi:site-specific DNA-methyltransferase (adenine-specific)